MPESIIINDVSQRALIEAEFPRVRAVITSPPYWSQRAYLPKGHLLKNYEIGAETDVHEYIENLFEVFRLCRARMLPDATLWVNIDDKRRRGRLVGAPQLLIERMQYGRNRRALEALERALEIVGQDNLATSALERLRDEYTEAKADLWNFNSCVIWHKPNATPKGSTAMRQPGEDHEYVLMFSLQNKFVYNYEAVRQPYETPLERSGDYKNYVAKTGSSDFAKKSNRARPRRPDKNGKLCRTVWSIPTIGYSGVHTATFPPELARKMVLASTNIDDWVLDPFNGVGTTAVMSIGNSRNYVGIEPYEVYCRETLRRLGKTQQLLF